MPKGQGRPSSRRRFLQCSTLATAGLSLGPHMVFGQTRVARPMRRALGRFDFDVTTLGLGGQASLQWTPADVDPVPIILKAVALGVNYFDTSNAYGPSQANFGKAFRQLHLVPGQSGYDEAKRRSIFLTSKTGLRWAKGTGPETGAPRVLQRAAGRRRRRRRQEDALAGVRGRQWAATPPAPTWTWS